MPALSRRLVAEGVGAAFLLAAIVGSGIMAERLAAGNVAIALLCNSLATGAMLYVLITILSPISGAHLNPAVTLAFLIRGSVGTAVALAYIACQMVGAVFGTWLAHAMFALPILELSTSQRAEASLWLAEAVATFGLVRHHRRSFAGGAAGGAPARLRAAAQAAEGSCPARLDVSTHVAACGGRGVGRCQNTRRRASSFTMP